MSTTSIQQQVREETANSKPTALVVEPVPSLARLLDAVLSDLGYRVLTYHEPDQALATLADRHCPIDVVVSEYSIHYLPATRLMRFIRHHRPAIPVILLHDVPLPEKDQPPSGVATLTKPFTRDEFVDLLEHVQEKAA